jgi:hypothetical protein
MALPLPGETSLTDTLKDVICKLLDGDRVILAKIDGELNHQVGSVIQWFGRFAATPRVLLLAGKKYRLELDDGRSGEITLKQVLATMRDQTVDFVNTGSFQ